MSYKQLVKILRDAGLELPPPVERFLAGEPVTFALDTRNRLRSWSRERGYTIANTKLLHAIVGRIAIHRRYLRHVVDAVVRVDLDGNQTEAPDAAEIAYAAARLATLRPKPKPPAAAELPPASKPPKAARPTAEAKPVVTKQRAVRAAATTISWVSRAAAPLRPVNRLAPEREKSKPKPGLPVLVVREAVELINNRRGSIRLIKAFKTNSAAIANERRQWIADATRRLAADGAGDTGGVDAQVAEMVDDMLVTVVPRAARS